ncbi:class I SAM-dependent methyltransferase [Paenibacillus sp. P26]|nr:class I SAM-dependent methyltransferase [Paenibacillus sp. P26]
MSRSEEGQIICRTFKEGRWDVITIQFAPQLYHWFIRPKWLTKKYIHNHIQSHFQTDGHIVLDFGSGTGANCSMFEPKSYLGIDPDAKRIAYAKRLYPEYTFQVFNNDKLPFEDQTVDYIFIIAVLHHIPTADIARYLQEFQRVLKPTGTIVVMEPCLCKEKPVCNWFMNWYDKGDYIRNEEEYLRLFQDYDSTILQRFRKCFLYHELFFSAKPKRSMPDQLVTTLLPETGPTLQPIVPGELWS